MRRKHFFDDPNIIDKVVYLDPMAGANIYKACEEAVEISKRFEYPAEFVFNGVLIKVLPDSKPEDLIKHYLNIL